MEYRLARAIIDATVPFPVILEQCGLDHRYDYSGKAYCPFHQNFNTPSAKLFKGEGVKGDTLMCFSERKVYHPSDCFKYRLINKNIIEVAEAIAQQLNPVQLKYIQESVGVESEDIKLLKEQLSALDDWKSGAMSWNDTVVTLFNILG